MNLLARNAGASLLCGMLACAGLTGCGSHVPDTIRIGVAVPLSGTTANRGKDLLNGAMLAADELNAAHFKVEGKPIHFEIVPKDDKGDNETSKKVAQELCNEKVHAVIGHLNSPNTAAAAPIYGANGMPLLTTSTQRKIPSLGNGNIFRLVANDAVQARALAGFATETLNGKRIVAIVEISDYGSEMYADMANALKEQKKEIALKQEVDFKGAVTEDMALKIKQAGADVIIVIGRELHALSLLEKLKAAQYFTPAVLVTNPIKTPKLANSDIGLRGIFATATVVEAGELPGGQDFLNRFLAKYNAEPVWGAHYAYDAVYAIADMVRRAGSADAPALIAKFKTVEPNTRVIQQMRFSASGEQAHPAIGIYKAERGQWVPQMRTAAW